MIRLIDAIAAGIGLILLFPIFIIIFVLSLFWHRKPFFVQKRIGFNEAEFLLFKFRTMQENAPTLGTHEISCSYITSFGHWLRCTKCDELPQLINVLVGTMSLVGPRPCLLSQTDVINARRERDCFKVRPGITGFAQILRVDMSDPERLAALDQALIERLCLRTYLMCVLQTVFGAGRGDAVRLHGVNTIEEKIDEAK